MRTRDNTDGKRHSSVGLSVMNARLYTDGGFSDGKGTYQVSVRRSMLDLMFKAVGQTETLPAFEDALGKATWDLSADHRLSFHILYAGDRTGVDNGAIDDYDLRYRSAYSWVTLRSVYSDALLSETLLGGSVLDQSREGAYRKYDHSDKGTFSVTDARDFTQLTLLQDGCGSRRTRSGSVPASRWPTSSPTTTTSPTSRTSASTPTLGSTTTSGTARGCSAPPASAAARTSRPGSSCGGRCSSSPASASIMRPPPGRPCWVPVRRLRSGSPRTPIAKVAWGLYNQSAYLYELDVANGARTFPPAERAEQVALSLEQRFADVMVVW